mgnify:CR=1 FL=1
MRVAVKCARPVLLPLLVVLALAHPAGMQSAIQEWPIYGGDAGGTKFSPLADIDRARLVPKIEWRKAT